VDGRGGMGAARQSMGGAARDNRKKNVFGRRRGIRRESGAGGTKKKNSQENGKRQVKIWHQNCYTRNNWRGTVRTSDLAHA